MIFSLKDLTAKLSPSESVDGLHIMKTNSFTLHHFQSLSGLVFIINSSPEIQGMNIYFILHIMKYGNPFYFKIYIKPCNIFIRKSTLNMWPEIHYIEEDLMIL
jgi:hypothetical protein